MEKKVAVLIIGCGNKDGSEITETVSVIIALSQLNVKTEFFSVDQEFIPTQFLTNQLETQPRNLMVEAARISRSQINPIESLVVQDFDALIIPGGLGVLTHLSNWSEKKHRATVMESVDQVIKNFYQQSKPIGAMCIAPLLLALSLGRHKINITLGTQCNFIDEVTKTGAIVESCPVTDFITDRLNKIVTTPAYMEENANPYLVFTGIQSMLKEVIEMA